MSISSLANKKSNQLYQNFSSTVNKTVNFNFMCLPKGGALFLSNVNNNEQLLSQFYQTDCTNDWILVISQNKTQCDGCNVTTTLSFVDNTKVPSDYYFAAGCLAGKKFTFGYIVDKKGVRYVSYQQNQFDLSSRCINKAINCAGSTVSNDPECPKNKLNSDCLNTLNTRCQQTGLFTDIDKLKSTQMNFPLYPSQCDYLAQKTSINSTAFVEKCFPWINSKLLINGFNFNSQNLINLETQLFTVETLLRFLQVNPGVKIVSTDPTANDTYVNLIRNITVNNTSINISGSTPETTADVAYIVNELNTTSNASQPVPFTPAPGSGNDGSLIRLSVSMISFILILII
jgi:hypothetical protein